MGSERELSKLRELIEMQARSGADIRGKVDIIAHGNYAALKREKRARRGADRTEFLFHGQVRPYKGLGTGTRFGRRRGAPASRA